MDKVLVTGITGNVGTYVYKELINSSQEVVGAVTSLSRVKRSFKEAELVEFDFLDKTTFDRALKEIDRVFLMRPPHIGKPQDIYPFIDAMKRNNVKFILFLSLMGIEKNPVPPHYKIEKYIEQSGISFCHIRPGFFMQNLSTTHAKEIKDKDEIFIPAGKSRCSFIDAFDIGLCSAKILAEYYNHQNTTYTITGGESLNYYEAAEVLSSVLNRKITYSKPSWLKFRHYMIKERKLDKAYVNVMIMLYFMTRLGSGSPVHHDFEKLTGRRPRTFKEFAEDNIEAWK